MHCYIHKLRSYFPKTIYVAPFPRRGDHTQSQPGVSMAACSTCHRCPTQMPGANICHPLRPLVESLTRTQTEWRYACARWVNIRIA